MCYDILQGYGNSVKPSKRILYIDSMGYTHFERDSGCKALPRHIGYRVDGSITFNREESGDLQWVSYYTGKFYGSADSHRFQMSRIYRALGSCAW